MLGLAASVVEVTEQHRASVEAEAARRRLTVIADATARIGTTLELDRTARELAGVAVPELADIAAVDLLEAVVGDIEDEHDSPDAPLIRKLNSNNYIASARAELSEVREMIGPEFNPGDLAEEVDTIGGLVFDLAGRVPAPGETVRGLQGFDFEILASDGRQIQKLKIKKLKPPTPRARADGPPPPGGSTDGGEARAAE